jgi:DNA repair exonuclease SbcCD ATPase subunit
MVAQMQSELDGMSLADIRDNLNYLNQTLTNKIDGLYLEFLDVNESLQDKISEAENSILENTTSENDILRSWLEGTLAGIETDLAQANSTICAQLSDILSMTSDFYTSIKDDLTGVFNSIALLEADLFAQHNAISGAVEGLNKTVKDAQDLSKGEIIDNINDSILQIQELGDNMTVHDAEIKVILSSLSNLVETENDQTKTELVDDLVVVSSQLQDLNSDIASHDAAVKGNLTGVSDLISDIEDLNISELDDNLSALAKSVSEHDKAISDDVSEIEQSVSDFEYKMDEKLTAINHTLSDLEKLDNILDDLIELDHSLQSADNMAQGNSDDGGGFMIAIMLLMVFFVILLLGMFLLFKENRMLKDTIGIGHKEINHPTRGEKDEENIV